METLCLLIHREVVVVLVKDIFENRFLVWPGRLWIWWWWGNRLTCSGDAVGGYGGDHGVCGVLVAMWW